MVRIRIFLRLQHLVELQIYAGDMLCISKKEIDEHKPNNSIQLIQMRIENKRHLLCYLFDSEFCFIKIRLC